VIKRKAADGSGEAEVLSVNASGWRVMWTYARTPDGKVQLAKAISSEETSRGWDIVAIHLERDGEVEPLLVSDDNEHFAALSPDGKWLAYVSDELDRDDVFVTSYPGLEGKWQVSTEGGAEPVWAPDGKSIYYRDGASLVAVPVESEGGFSPGRAQRLFEDVYVPRPSSRNYDIHTDGKQFLMIKTVEVEEELPMTELIVVENWFEELKRLAPTGKD
jgi:serine/threonine-protein kinase